MMKTDFFKPQIRDFASKIFKATEQLSTDRKKLLTEAATNMNTLLADYSVANLLFVCTHNSRRSQFAQAWAYVAADFYGLQEVSTHSCGTETTACNIRTVESLRRVGMQLTEVEQSESSPPASAAALANPHYEATYRHGNAKTANDGKSSNLVLFSKAFGHPSLPTENILAMMCCSDADEKCPVVPGAAHRIALHYVDPKQADDTPQQAETYDARSLQIASEMFFMIQQVRVG
ncbi:MAG: protein tyrosine phosphatase [Pirellulaceae bacterium]